MALEDYRPDQERCSYCSYCKWIPQDKIKSWRFAKGCPSIAYNNFNAYSARGRFAVARSLLDGKITYTDQVLDIIYQDLSCGSCDVSDKVCRYNLEPLQNILELKARAVMDGQILPQHMPVIDNLRKEDTMIVGMVKDKRGEWAEGLHVKDITDEKSEIAFFAGCRFSYDKELWKVPRAAISLFQKAGVDIGIMGGNESCCGGRAYQMGYRGEFVKFAENNIEAWKTAGVKTVVTSCSDGYYAFKRLYPELGSKVEVLHTLEFIDRLIKEGKLKLNRSVPLSVTYHDPCHLGRQGEPYVPWQGKERKILNQVVIYNPPKPRYNGAWGIYDPPRDILKSIPGLKFSEMERIREYSWCCGAGGGCLDAYPEFSAWTAGERLTEARSAGAEAIVTACPWCERSFMDAVDEHGNKMQVFDLVELVQQSI
ncbi:MAG: (Fe-S)-binding protein [Dehalococcoidales bacterium]|nr:(Fe-S)-binding protein [Dehalococcoidales bacterium]